MTDKSPTVERPREHALSTGLLARVFHQPSLIYFNAVATHLSIREAARRLDIASSAITRQVAQLEDALGIALFIREKRRLRLSPAGEILFRHSRRLAAPIEAAVSEIEMLRGIKSGSVRIAAAESIGLSFLPRLITDFGRRYPRLNLDVSLVSSVGVIERLLDERVDIGLGFIAKPPRQIDVAFRRDVRIGAVMTPGHPLAASKHLTFRQCIEHPLAVAKPEISIREVIEPFLRGSLVDRMQLDEIAADTRLRRRAGKPCVLRAEGDRLHLLLGDRRLSVPSRLTEAVEQVRALGTSQGELTPGDLPLDPQSSLVLCRRLVREGLLEVVR